MDKVDKETVQALEEAIKRLEHNLNAYKQALELVHKLIDLKKM
jgi:exonuclease VII small subunit